VHCITRFRIFFVLLLLPIASLHAADVLQIRDGDRILLIGSTTIEREQSYGYWETALYASKPDVNFSLRNLGWSGDTVWSESRAGFETPEYGFKELQKLVETLQPTLIVVNYGFNESFAGEPGLAKFKEGLKRLTEMLSATKARIVLVSPTRMEYRNGKFPDHKADNRNIELYRDAIRDFAAEHQFGFGDWTDSVIPPAGSTPLSTKQALTDNGLHLTEDGYRKTASALSDLAGSSHPEHNMVVDVAAKTVTGFAEATDVSFTDSLSFTATSKQLAFPTDLRSLKDTPTTYVVSGLKPGTEYWMHIDGNRLMLASGKQWASGVSVGLHQDSEQAEELRQTILRKNELFFHRWRPQNVTYLFGFRKHEQGQNAKEVAEFEPLVQEQDKLISELKKPRPHKYEFIPKDENK